MTNEELHHIIFLANTHQGGNDLIFHPIHPFVDKGVYFDHDFLSNNQAGPYSIYLILDNPEHYAEIVLDMNHDLHVYTLPECRGKGLMKRALGQVILPYLFEEKETIEITISDDASSTEAPFLATSLGFEKIGINERGSVSYQITPESAPLFKLFKFPISLTESRSVELKKEVHFLVKRLRQIYHEAMIGLGDDLLYPRDFEKYDEMISGLMRMGDCIYWSQKDAKDDASKLPPIKDRRTLMHEVLDAGYEEDNHP